MSGRNSAPIRAESTLATTADAARGEKTDFRRKKAARWTPVRSRLLLYLSVGKAKYSRLPLILVR
jgi:hypothetical protein